MARSKIKNFSPVTDNEGNHRTWTSKDGKTYYSFNVTFEDGVSGQALSTSSSPKWQIGKDYTYEASTNDRGFTNIKNMKSADFVPGGKVNSPEENDLIAYEEAVNISILNFMAKDAPFHFNDIFEIAEPIYNVLRKEIGNNQNFKITCSAMRMAVTISNTQAIMKFLESEKVKSLKDLFLLHTYLYGKLKYKGSPGSVGNQPGT